MTDTPDVRNTPDDDDGWLLDRLRELLPAQWDLLLSYAHVPGEYVAGGMAALGTRATDVLRWSRLSVNYECALLEALAKVEPAFAADVERRLAKLRAPRPGTDSRLAELQEQYDLARASDDTARLAALKGELLRLKRERRDGGQIHAGDFLGGHDNDVRYKLLEFLGKGGFATVWKAYDRQARRFVAVKVLHAEQARDASHRERFFRGARAMARLNHPHIVRVFEPHAEDHGWHYFVMELIEGEALDLAVCAGHVDAQQGLNLVLEIADALKYAHGKGLLHRDVAPPNILVDRAGHAHLGDFDLVRTEDTVGGTHTSMLGRFLYAAPELLRRPQDADARADIYALAMTLVFIYRREALSDDVLYERDAYLASLACPDGVRAVIRRAIMRRPEERFDSMETLANELRTAHTGDRLSHMITSADVEGHLAELHPPRPGTDGRLAELQEQYDLARAAGDTTRVQALKEDLLRLRRELRASGQIHAGDILGPDANNRYEILELLGQGGFATVWKAYDHRGRRFVAVKILHADHARNESRRERFFRGARAMARLDHPHIVRVFEPHAEDDGWHYFVMELIEGQDLDSAVRAGRVGAEQGLNLVLEIATALSHAHAHGLVHRDVAPPNILVDRAGHAHLGDFDLVRAEDSVGGTRTSMLGRFIYAAPELMSDPKRADARTDVYALAMTLAFIYAQAPLPLTALTAQGAYLRSLPFPPGVRTVVERAIRHEMGERFDSVAAFADELRAACSRGEAPRVGARAVVSGEQPMDPKPGDVWTEPKTDLTFVWIPPGEFLMGSSKTEGEPGYDPQAWDDETPPRRVRISAGFWLGQHPVTNEQYARFVAEGGAEPTHWRNPRFTAQQQPVVGVSFEDASGFCAWATKRTGLTGEVVIQLPTEAEWEYAARGEEGRRYPWGSAEPTPEHAVWGLDWKTGAPAAIGQRPQGATPLDTHDLAGNVWEWCLDGWRETHLNLSTPHLDPCVRATRAAPRVLRGGSWLREVGSLRCATRDGLGPGRRDRDFGFRVVCRRFRAYLTD